MYTTGWKKSNLCRR